MTTSTYSTAPLHWGRKKLDLVRQQTTRYGAAERGYYSYPLGSKNGSGMPSSV